MTVSQAAKNYTKAMSNISNQFVTPAINTALAKAFLSADRNHDGIWSADERAALAQTTSSIMELTSDPKLCTPSNAERLQNIVIPALNSGQEALLHQFSGDKATLQKDREKFTQGHIDLYAINNNQAIIEKNPDIIQDIPRLIAALPVDDVAYITSQAHQLFDRLLAARQEGLKSIQQGNQNLGQLPKQILPLTKEALCKAITPFI